MTVKRPAFKAALIDKVTEYGEELTAKEIAERVNDRLKDEVDGIEFNSRCVGGVMPHYLNHKFRRIRRHSGLPSLWRKVAS